VADESVRSHAPESLEELSGEWMRQQLQESAVHTRPPSQEPARQPEPASRPSAERAAAAAPAGDAEPGADDVLTGLAQSVSQAVVSAVSQLEHRRAEEKRSLEHTVQEQSQRLDNALERIAQIQERFDKVAHVITEQQALALKASDTYERLTGEISEIQKRDAGRESVLEELRRETLDLSVSVSDRQDQTSGRLDLQQTDISELKTEIANLKPGMEQAVQRLERHSQVIRAVFEAEKRREEALARLSDAASNLKESTLRYPEGLSEELL
jgi:DNA repair exonuclease SbcCD ATPase subunit